MDDMTNDKGMQNDDAGQGSIAGDDQDQTQTPPAEPVTGGEEPVAETPSEPTTGEEPVVPGAPSEEPAGGSEEPQAA